MNPTDVRLFAIAAAFKKGYSVDKIWQMTNIDKWFLTRLYKIHTLEQAISYVETLYSGYFCVLTQSDRLLLQCLQHYLHQSIPSPTSQADGLL